MEENSLMIQGNNLLDKDILEKFKRQNQVMEEMAKEIEIRNE